MALFYLASAIVVVLVLYLALINYGMQQGAVATARDIGVAGWTESAVRDTAAIISKQPLDFRSQLPPSQDRRYIIVGGSGFVGGSIVRHLLARGQSPQSLRILDLRKPSRSASIQGEDNEVPFVQADISSLDSTLAAFGYPWPQNFASKPLTVFHIAAIIRPSERSRLTLPISERINVDGTRNVVQAARSVGADILIATASSTIDLRPTNFWLPSSGGVPRNVFQVCGDADEIYPVREYAEYFSNYGYTKALAERIVLEANDKTMLTGCIRASVVYGGKNDLLLGPFVHQGLIQTYAEKPILLITFADKIYYSWFAGMFISCVNVQNLSLAHLQYEQALLSPNSTASGKSFIISDPGGPVRYGDMHKLLRVLIPGFKVQTFPPVMMLSIAHCIEWYCLIRARWPRLQLLLPELPPLISQLQPAVFSSCNIHQIANVQGAQQSISNGGFGYKGACTTLQGMCMQILQRDIDA